MWITKSGCCSDVNKTFCQDQDQDSRSQDQDQDLNIFQDQDQDQDFLVKTKARLFSSRPRPRPRPRLYSDHYTGYDIMFTKWTQQYTHDTDSCVWHKDSRSNLKQLKKEQCWTTLKRNLILHICDTIRYDTVDLHALKRWRDGQLNLAHGQETKNNEKIKIRNRVAQKKRCRQKSVEAVREEEVKLRG